MPMQGGFDSMHSGIGSMQGEIDRKRTMQSQLQRVRPCDEHECVMKVPLEPMRAAL